MQPRVRNLVRLLPVAIVAPVLADATPPNDDLSREIRELREQNASLAAKVDRLEQDRSATGDGWLTEARAAEIRGLVQDTLADATTRTSLQSSGATAGWDKGFFLASADGNFRLNVKGQLQVRWALDHRDRPAGTSSNYSGLNASDSWGWELRRARLWFGGFIIDPSWEYELQIAYDRRGGNQGGGTLENAWIRKTVDAFGGKLALRAGQFKPPFNKEELVSSTRQLTVERTLVNEVFTTKWSQGLELTQTWDSFRVAGFYGDRLRAEDTIPTSGVGTAGNLPDAQNNPSYAVPQVDYALAGRVEWKLAGSWKQFDDLNSFRGDEFGAAFGLAAMAQNLRGVPGQETVNGSTFFNPSSMWGLTGDVTLDFGGASLFAAAYYRQVTLASAQAVRGGGTNDGLDQWGFTIQGSYFLTEDLEPYARWEIGNTDTDQYRTANAAARAVNADSDNVITLGTNWYPAGSKNKAIKLSGDVGFSLAPIVDFAKSGANWQPALTPAAGADYAQGQVVIRAQLQLLF